MSSDLLPVDFNYSLSIVVQVLEEVSEWMIYMILILFSR